MYVCICNTLTDGKIRSVAAESRGSAAAVYQALGCRPQCGRCVPMVSEMVRQSDRDPTAEMGAAIV